MRRRPPNSLRADLDAPPTPFKAGVEAGIVERLRAAGCVFAEDEARLLVGEAKSPEQLGAMVARRIDGEPLEYIAGWAQFYELRIAVAPGVFVPRRRTEFLVAQAVSLAPPRALVLDLCCGSGVIGAALAARLDGAQVFATDVDPTAIACARHNIPDGQVFVGDLYDPVPTALRGRVDVLVANAPYVPTDEVALMPREAHLYELRAALDGGPDGLDLQRRVAAGAAAWLAPTGHLLIETSARQAPLTAEIMSDGGLSARVVHDSDLDATVVIGQRA
jgi:release factor glutamine methyltransferase